MTQFRTLFAGLVAVILVASAPASAAEWTEYSPEALEQAQSEGKPILVDVFAAWCSVCRAQNPILTQLTREPKYKDLVVFKADFDKDKEELKALNVQRQSTLIVFKDGKEVDRSVGDTSQLSIEGLLDKTL
jgi:thiol-disulfide isomerase/thioredoxin